MGLAHKGKKHTEETKKKMSKSHIGFKHSEKTKVKMSQSKIGKKGISWSKEMKDRRSLLQTGRKHSLETRIKISENHKGENAPNWKGGVTSINAQLRNSLEYRLWRESIFKRDNYQCVWGGKEHGNKLQADHIKPFAYFPELRFAIDNGRTLCENCHKSTETYLNNYKKNEINPNN